MRRRKGGAGVCVCVRRVEKRKGGWVVVGVSKKDITSILGVYALGLLERIPPESGWYQMTRTRV